MSAAPNVPVISGGRIGPSAARVPQVPGAVRRERAARLRALEQDAHRRRLQRRVGTAQRLLVDGNGRGRAEDVPLCDIDGGLPGTVVGTTIVGENGERLLARTGAAIHAA